MKEYILITGVAGFIGHALAKVLLSKGMNVIGIDNMKANTIEIMTIKRIRLKECLNHKNFSFIKEDIKNIVKESLRFDGVITHIIHLAANAGIRDSFVNSNEYIENNIIGFNIIINIAKELNVKHFIYASSSSIYGNCRNCNSDKEINEYAPKNIYAITKIADELIAKIYSENCNLKVTGLRFFSVYGPYGRPDMAPWIFAKSILNQLPINVNNEGNVLRDFTYIDDIVASIITIIEKGNKRNYTVYDIGSSCPYSLNELIEIIEDTYKIDAIRVNTSQNLVEANYTIANMEYFNDDYPRFQFQNFESGVSEFCNWLKQYEQRLCHEK